MGYLSAIWHITRDPTDPTLPYTPYTFISAGHTGPANMTMSRDYGRRESILVIPGADGVENEYGSGASPMERIDQTFAFRRFTGGDNDAEYDRLAAWLAPGNAIRLVYLTDAGALRYAKAYNPRVQNTETSGGNWGSGGYQDFTVTWLRTPWTPGHSETAELFHTGSVFHTGTTFGTLGTTTIASTSQLFSVDATGVAGVDLPTLPDTGPTITVFGPAGGDGGLRVSNGAALVQDTNGSWVSMYFDIPFKLPTAYDAAVLKFASQSFIADGLSFRPSKPAYQRECYFMVKNGVVNNCAAVALGSNAVVGGSIKVDWTKRFA